MDWEKISIPNNIFGTIHENPREDRKILPQLKETVKAILIQTEDHIIKEVEVENFRALYGLIGCSLVEPVRLDGEDTLYLDEEGRLKYNSYLSLKNYPSILAGNGVVIGEGEEDLKDTSLTVEKVKELIRFLTPKGIKIPPTV